MTTREAILSLLMERDAGKTICPSEAARRVAGAQDWHQSMKAVRAAGRQLAAEGLIEVTKKGKVVNPDAVKGVIRYRLKTDGQGAKPGPSGVKTAMADPKLDEVEALMRDVADRLILPRWRSLSDSEIEEKTGPGDLVTIADREAEEALTPVLEAMVPGSVVVGEEAVSAGKVSADILKEDRDLWLVDPVDGTWNFVQGFDRFGVMVAFIRAGIVVKSWILLPVDGRCAVAEKGAGATFGGQRLGPHAATPFAQARGDYSSAYVEEPFQSAFTTAVARCAGARAGHCSAYAYTDLARGLIDYVLQYRMTAWDHAPGQLIVEEAGGRFGFLPDGDQYTPIPRDDRPMLQTAVASVWPDYAAEFSAELSASLKGDRRD